MSGTVGLESRHASRIDVVGDCWLWTGNRNKRGYGLACIHHTKMQLAHRLVYEALVRPLSAGEVLHHLCEQKLCVNPEHMQPMTRSDHARLHPDNNRAWRDRMQAKTHCLKRGHELTAENTRIKQGRRVCRDCQRIDHNVQQRAYRARRRVESFREL